MSGPSVSTPRRRHEQNQNREQFETTQNHQSGQKDQGWIPEVGVIVGRAQIANGKTVDQVCKIIGITAQTYYRWRREYGGMKVDQAKRLKEVERENARLKKLVAELSLDKAMLQEIASGNF